MVVSGDYAFRWRWWTYDLAGTASEDCCCHCGWRAVSFCCMWSAVSDAPWTEDLEGCENMY